MIPLHQVSTPPFIFVDTPPFPNISDNCLVELADLDNSVREIFARAAPIDVSVALGGPVELPPERRYKALYSSIMPLRREILRAMTAVKDTHDPKLPIHHDVKFSPFLEAMVTHFHYFSPSTPVNKGMANLERGIWSVIKAKHTKEFSQETSYVLGRQRRRQASFEKFLSNHHNNNIIYLGLQGALQPGDTKVFIDDMRVVNAAVTNRRERFKYHLSAHFHPVVGYIYILAVAASSDTHREELLRHIQVRWTKGLLTPNVPDRSRGALIQHYQQLLTGLTLARVKRRDDAAGRDTLNRVRASF